MRAINKWLLPALLRQSKLKPLPVKHVFLAICDHFEPLHRTDAAGARQRLSLWRREYPALVDKVRDSDGRGPRHTFFYPIEQYDAAHVEIIGEICAETGSEIEVQLHHDGDTEATLRRQIEAGLTQLTNHGHLSHDAEGRTRFGFVHGNWALCHSRPDGRWCGVPTEIRALRELGCYADFTYPSAPSDTQPRSVNSIGYARESGSCRSLDSLVYAAYSETSPLRASAENLLLVQGPLALNWRWRKWGLFPRLENADLTAVNPPTPTRLQLWLDQRIHVAGREDWVFVKLHAHGAVDANAAMLLGDQMASFHRHFTEELPRRTGTQVHYVTAREMVNLIHAAEDEAPGEPAALFDYCYRRPAPSR